MSVAVSVNDRGPTWSVTGPGASARVHSSALCDVTSAAVTPKSKAACALAGSALAARIAASAAPLVVLIRLGRRVRPRRRRRRMLAVDGVPEHPVQRSLGHLVDRAEIKPRRRTGAGTRGRVLRVEVLRRRDRVVGRDRSSAWHRTRRTSASPARRSAPSGCMPRISSIERMTLTGSRSACARPRRAFAYGLIDERRDPVRVDVVGAVLRVVLDHEDRRLTSRSTSARSVSTICAEAEVVVGDHRLRRARARPSRPCVWSLVSIR